MGAGTMTDYERIKREYDLSLLQKNGLLNRIYPVGSIYMSVNEVSPAVLFGGVWERIENAFLLAASSAHPTGERGGEERVALTEGQMPHHKHYLLASVFHSGTDNAEHQVRTWTTVPDTDLPYALRTAPEDANYGRSSGAGGGQSHNNMPPYLSVCMWVRIK